MRPFLFLAALSRSAVSLTALMRQARAGCPCYGFAIGAFAFAVTMSGLRAAEPQRFESGPTRVALIELYTSEGCSSCPPAEKWLGTLRDDNGLWKTFVPVAWHVNYWDKLGWPDRFASREGTQREY